MGDEQNERPPVAAGRAPWERSFGRPLDPTPVAPPEPRPEPQPPAASTPEIASGNRHASASNGFSVGTLVAKARGVSKPPQPPRPAGLLGAAPPPPPPAPEPEPEPEPMAEPSRVGSPDATRLARSKRIRHQRTQLIARAVVAMGAVVALILTGTVWVYLRATDNGFAQVAALDENSTDVVDPAGQTGDETYLIVGTDNRAGKNADVGAGGADQFEGYARSDTVMLVNIPANRQRVVVVSFPRDLDVHRPACQGWDNSKGSYTSEYYPAADGDKLNATYALGGPKCLVKVIQKLSGLKIGHFVGMDFAGFESMVNEVGGVQVCTSTPLIDGELGPILTETGTQTLNGATALNYVRARTIAAEGNGDYGRITRQQRFLSSLLRSALSNKVLLDPGKMNRFIAAFTSATFVEKVTTKDLVALGRSLQNVDAGAVTFLTVPTAGTNENGNEIPRLDDIKAIFEAIINDDPLPGEKNYTASSSSSTSTSSADSPTTSTTAPATTTSASTSAGRAATRHAVDPSSVTLQVSNASGVAGQAAQVANSLGAYGFRIYTVGNYTDTSSTTTVRYSTGHETEAATVASAVPAAVLESSEDLGSIVEVVLGTDFGGTVHQPAAAGSTITADTSPAQTPQLPSDLAHVNAADKSCD